jgi:ABC-type lipoprotein release transport system permease subunit
VQGERTNKTDKNEKQLSKIYFLLIFSLNSFIIYMFFPLVEIFYAFLILTIVFFIVFVRLLLNKEAINEIKKFSPWICYKYIKMNRRHIIYSSLGLSFAILLLSMSVLIPQYHEKSIMVQFFQENTDVPALMFSPDPANYFNHEAPYILDISKNVVSSILVNHNLILSNYTYAYYSEYDCRFNETNYVSCGNNSSGDSDPFSINLVSSTPYIYDLLRSLNPTLTTVYNPNKAFLAINFLQFSGLIEYNHNSMLVNFTRTENGDLITHEFNLDFDEIVHIENLNYESRPASYYGPINWKISQDPMTLVLPSNTMYDFLDSLYLEGSYFSSILMQQIWFLDINSLGLNKGLDDLRAQFNSLENLIKNELDRKFNEKIGKNIAFQLQSPLNSILDRFYYNLFDMRMQLLLITTPFLIMGLFLAYFNLDLLNQHKHRLIGILKSRGASKTQIMQLISFEVIITVIISIVTGILLTFPALFLFLFNTDQSLFNDFIKDKTISFIPHDWIWQIPLIGIIFSISINLSSINSLMSINVEQSKEPVDTNESLIQKNYIDIILVVIAVFSIILLSIISVYNPRTDLLNIFSFFSNFIVFIASILILHRLIDFMLIESSQTFWIKRSDSLQLSLINLRKHKNVVKKLMSLLTLGLMIAVGFTVIAYSDHLNREEAVQYSTGSDIRISSDREIPNYNLTEIQGVKSISRVQSYYFSSNLMHHIRLIIVDPNTFADVIYWRSHYSDMNLEDLMNDISINDTAVTYSPMNNFLGVNRGDELNVRHVTKNYAFTVGHSFNQFSGYLYYHSGEYSSSSDHYGSQNIGFLLISNLTFFRFISSLGQTVISDNIQNNLFIKMSENADRQEVLSEIRSLYGDKFTISSVDTKTTHRSMISNEFLTKTTYILIGVSMLMLVVSTSIYSRWSFQQRRYEFGILRTLGMTNREMVKLIITESTIISTFTVAFGTLMGFLISYHLMNQHQFSTYYQFPKAQLYIPLGFVSIITLSATILIILINLLPNLNLRKINVSTLFRDNS